LPAKSQNGIQKDSIVINKENNSYTTWPLSSLYEHRKIQILLDSAASKEALYKKIIEQKDIQISEIKNSNTELKKVAPLLLPQINTLESKNADLKVKNGKLTLGIVILGAITTLETILLLK